MANERIHMRKIKEAMRLLLGLKFSQAQTAKSLNVGRTTIVEYARRFKASGLSWPLPEGLDDRVIEERLFPKQPSLLHARPIIPLEYLSKEMKRPNVTLMLLWEEYKKADPTGYQYSQFAKLYKAYQKTLSYSMRQDHKGGEKVFVDFGAGLHIRDARTGILSPISLFVAVWGASSYLFAHATAGEDLRSWIGVHVKCFEFCECSPKALVPDNLKSGVTKACRYEPEINRTYADLAAHYSLCVFPARPYRPKDKGKVENGVLLAKRWIMARLRNQVFESLGELNEAIMVLVVQFNDRIMRRPKTSRKALFWELDKPNARPLPEHPFEFADWEKHKVGVNYHIEFDKNFYSVPYTLIHQELEMRGTSTVVEFLQHSQRILTHPRSFLKNHYTTRGEHMPLAHQKYLEWTPERILHWAEKYGPSVKEIVEKLMAARSFPQQAYRSSLGIIQLAKRYGAGRLENACKRALLYRSLSYGSVKRILEKGLDGMKESPAAQPLIQHDNLRGPEYYQSH